VVRFSISLEQTIVVLYVPGSKKLRAVVEKASDLTDVKAQE